MSVYSEPVKVTKITIRQGASIALGTIIDGYLNDEENEVLYKRWRSDWPEPLLFSGGITAITCEMVLEVPHREMMKAFGVKRGNHFIDVAKENASYV